MNTYISLCGATLVVFLAGGTAAALADDEYSLEPCINGSVSSSGLFANQATEQRYLDGLARQGERSTRLAGD